MIRFTLSLALLVFAAEGNTEVIAASPDHFTLRHEARSSWTPDAVWERLIHPETWWSASHTYSGNASNLSLTPQAGGFWREDWTAGSVVHGTVLYVNPGKQLRLEAPFGPLQSMAVTVIWTITILPDGAGARVVFDEVANGSSASELDKVAGAVDAVKAEAMQRLVGASQ